MRMKHINFLEACHAYAQDIQSGSDYKIWYKHRLHKSYQPLSELNNLDARDLAPLAEHDYYQGVIHNDQPLLSGIEELPEDPKTVLVIPDITSAIGCSRIKWNKNSDYIKRLLEEGLLYTDTVEAARVALYLRCKINLPIINLE